MCFLCAFYCVVYYLYIQNICCIFVADLTSKYGIRPILLLCHTQSKTFSPHTYTSKNWIVRWSQNPHLQR